MPTTPNAEIFDTNAPGRGETQEVISNYDFATDGGVIGDIALRGEALPLGAIVTDALIIVDTIPTGAGATIAVKVEGAADIQAAAAISGTPWSTTGAKRASAVTATSAVVTTTASRQPTITVATAALTAGKFKVILKYVLYNSARA